MVLIEFSMFPLDKGESLSPYVARILDVIDKSGVNYRLNPMGTVLEGNYDEVMEVVRKCFNELEKDCTRISMALKMDYRKTGESRLDTKIEKIESILNRELRK
ncbi:MAG: MTH1187 family thiamine-binding protein [Calditrichaeota bacterium]|nr:MTH1187 family thiamine-binding protein [Calditrichota bacterium]